MNSATKYLVQNYEMQRRNGRTGTEAFILADQEQKRWLASMCPWCAGMKLPHRIADCNYHRHLNLKGLTPATIAK